MTPGTTGVPSTTGSGSTESGTTSAGSSTTSGADSTSSGVSTTSGGQSTTSGGAGTSGTFSGTTGQFEVPVPPLPPRPQTGPPPSSLVGLGETVQVDLPVDLPLETPADLLAAARLDGDDDTEESQSSSSLTDRPWLWAVVAVGCIALIAVVVLSFFIIKHRNQTRSMETV